MYNTRVNPEISNELRVMIRQGGLILEETVPPETEHAVCGAGLRGERGSPSGPVINLKPL